MTCGFRAIWMWSEWSACSGSVKWASCRGMPKISPTYSVRSSGERRTPLGKGMEESRLRRTERADWFVISQMPALPTDGVGLRSVGVEPDAFR